MNMHPQSATNRRHSQEQKRDLHAYNPGARRPEFVQVQLLAPIASKKFGLENCCPCRHQSRVLKERGTAPSNTSREEPNDGQSHSRSRCRRRSSEVQFDEAEPSPATRLAGSRRSG